MKSKIALTVDAELVTQVDRLVKEQTYPNRSRMIEEALREKLARMDRNRLARELAKLDPDLERSFAEEALIQDGVQWPEY